MRITRFFFIGFALALTAFSCPTNALAAESKTPLAVTVSIPPQKYFLEKVGGDDVAVTVMAAKGQDPHTYEPTAAQMEGVTRAELYFTIGVPFETQWVPKFHSLNPSMHVVNLLAAIPRIDGKPDLALRDTVPGKGRQADRMSSSTASQAVGSHEHNSRHDHDGHDHESEAHTHAQEGHGQHHHGLDTDDPHVWLSPSDMMQAIPLITAALTDKRPDKKGAFESRANTLLQELTALDTELTALLAPIENRTFMTFHQSWAHYARTFNLREVSVELEGREPGPKSMALLMDFAKANNIRVIVADSMTGKSSVEAIARNINATVIQAAPLAENWPVALREFSQKLAKALAGTHEPR